MKKIAALALTLAFLLSLSTAFAWSCPGCGSEMNGKFCTECGAKKPANVCPECGTDFGDTLPKFCTECGTKLAAASTATPAPAADAEEPQISYATQTGGGSIGVVWMADGTQEYTVEYVLKQSNDPYADRAANDGFYTFSGKSSIGMAACGSVIPGEDYWIGLFDAQGRGHYAPFEGSPAGTFDDFEITPLVLPQRVIGGEKDTVYALSVEEIEAGVSSGLYFGMYYQNPGEAQEYDAQIVLEAPNGARYPISADLKLEKTQEPALAGWRHVELLSYFGKLKKGFGEIPAGEYKVSLYLDLNLAFTTSFRVQQNAVRTEVSQATPTPAPTAPDRADITTIVSNGDGGVTVSWTGGIAPYKVQYTLKQSDAFETDRKAAQECGIYWNGASNVTGQSVVLSRLIPGREYWIVVSDANGKGQCRAFTPDTGSLTDINATLSVAPRAKTGDTTSDLVVIPANAAGLEDDTLHGLYMKLDYTNPGETREMNMQIVLGFSNGMEYVYSVGAMEFTSGKDNYWQWKFYDIDDMFAHLRSCGAVPEGDMTVSIYLDGKLACSAAAPIAVQKPVVITGVADQGNGVHLLSWEDNGNGPFDVHYVQKFSDDITADRADERGTGYWIDAEDTAGTSRQMQYLMPGTSYWITVTDSTGMVGVTTYDVPAAKDANLGVHFTYSYRQQVNGVVSDISAFSAAEISQNNDVEYGLYLEMTYNKRSTEAKLPCQWVMTLPTGEALCTDAFDMIWYEGDSCYWDFFSVDWALGRVNAWYDGVRPGTYRFDLYSEGDHAGSFTFEIGE